MNRALSATSKIVAAALALSLLAGQASAAALCARPQDMTALRAAALRQELMVAALTCHFAADFNLFVTTYRDELLKSDRALRAFFLRQNASKGEDAYNTYKTRLANSSSLRSLHDPRFCRNAKVVFAVALKRKGAVAALASERPTPIATGYTICSPGVTETVVAVAAPSPPARRLALLDSPPSVPIPKLAPRPPRASPPLSPQHDARVALLPRSYAYSPRDAGPLPARVSHEIDAHDREADAKITNDAGERDDVDRAATDEYDDAGDYAPRYVPRYAAAQPPRIYGRSNGSSGYSDGSYADHGPGADRDTYNASYDRVPDAYKPNAYWVHPYGPSVRPRLVRGPDGHWYLLPYSGR